MTDLKRIKKLFKKLGIPYREPEDYFDGNELCVSLQPCWWKDDTNKMISGISECNFVFDKTTQKLKFIEVVNIGN